MKICVIGKIIGNKTAANPGRNDEIFFTAEAL
jgi:hypothetical protein